MKATYFACIAAAACTFAASTASAQECQIFATWPSGSSGSGTVVPPSGYSFEPGWGFWVTNPYSTATWTFITDPTYGYTSLFARVTFNVQIPIDTNVVTLYGFHGNTPNVEISIDGGLNWTSYQPPPFPPTPTGVPYSLTAHLTASVSASSVLQIQGAGFEYGMISICVEKI